MYRLLIVEDDPVIAGAVADKAARWGLETRTVEDFSRVISDFAEFSPHIVLLDISLPRFDGYHWCREIRAVSKTPVIFISSASDNMNIIMAMNLGADDFISKPFDTDVLIAKIQAMLRRTYDFSMSTGVFEHRGAILSTGDGTLTYNGVKIPLTKNEYRILLSLFENKGKIVSREKIMETIWQTDSFIDENTLNVNINRLRKKLSAAGLDGFITTRVGSGYMIS